MKRRQRDPEKFDLLRLLDAFAQARGLKINEPEDQAAILEVLTKAVSQAPKNEALMHGTRVEAMFGYVASALGYCVLVKEEDAGELYSMPSDVIVPDYRLLTLEDYEFLVEVKNCHETDMKHQYRLTQTYFEALCKYAALFKLDLKIAIYWSQFRLWSLVPAKAFEFDGSSYSLSMFQCMKRSEMNLLGDAMVGTVPPLIFRLLSHPDEPRTINSNREVAFIIGGVQLFCGDREIKDSFEKKLAWFLLRYGDWDTSEDEVEIRENKLIWVQVVANKERVEGQEFATLGFLSRMISAQFNELTTEEGEIMRLAPTPDPSELGLVIPKDYTGSGLPLWRFIMSPNYE